jgi:hypothetical protein
VINVSRPEKKWYDEPIEDPREDGFDEEQAKEIEAYERGVRRFYRELAEED